MDWYIFCSFSSQLARSFQNVCKRPAHPAHPKSTVWIKSWPLQFVCVFVLTQSARSRWIREARKKCRAFESESSNRGVILAEPGESFDGVGNFRRTVRRQRSYHRFVVATVSAFKKGTPGVVAAERETSFSTFISVCPRVQTRVETQYGVILACFLYPLAIQYSNILSYSDTAIFHSDSFLFLVFSSSKWLFVQFLAD